MTDVARLSIAVDSRQVQTGTRDLNRMGDQARVTEQRVTRATQRINRGMVQSASATNAFTRAMRGPGMRNASLQLSQVAQQASATGDPLRALAIQLPDLTLGFGPLGIAAGVVAGALLPLAANLFTTTVNAEDAETAIDDFASAVDSYVASAEIALSSLSDLREEFGSFAEEVQASAEIAARAAAQNAVSVFANTASALEERFASILEINDRLRERTQEVAQRSLNFPDFDLTEAVRGLDQLRAEARAAAGEIGMSVQEVDRLSAAFDNFAGARTFDEIVEQAGDVLAEIDRISGASGQIPVALRPAAAALVEIQRNAAIAGRNSEDLATELGAAEAAALGLASVDIKFGIAAAADEASRLAGSLLTALSYSDEVNASIIRGGVADGSLPPEALGDAPQTGADAAYQRAMEGRRRSFPARVRSSGRSGGGGGGGGGIAEQTAAMQMAEQAIRQAERAAVDFAEVQAILDERLSNGSISAEEYSLAIDDLAEQFAQGGSLEAGIASISDLVGDMAVDFDNAADIALQALQRLAQGLISSGIEQYLSGRQGGGLLGTILSGFSFGGFRASGGPVAPGQSYVVGERGPELFTPGVSGGITPNAGNANVTVIVENNAPNTEARRESSADADGRRVERIIIGTVNQASRRGRLANVSAGVTAR